MNTDNTHNSPGQDSDKADPAAPKARSVLLVDDNAQFRMIVELNLKRLGYDVSNAGSGEEAIEIATRNKDIQLLITDFEMPGMNGSELVRKIRGIRPRVKVLAISGFPPRVVGGINVANRPDHFLQKPFRPAELDERIKSILARD
jgi:CheY-like chemotaxis protein